MRKLLFSALMVLNLMVLQAQQSELFHAEVFVSVEGSLPYRIMLPENFDPSGQYPLVFFLHGAGERGNDNEKQLVHGASFFASAENRTNFPAIVIFPQCAEGDFWANVNFHFDQEGNRSFSFDPSGEPVPSMKLAIKLLESMLKNDWVDKDRVYVGGLSMGGMGTFELLYRMPEVFAAAFPICGGGNPEVINPEVRQVNVWVFHGDADMVVPASLSEVMVDAYKTAGVEVKLTLYPGVGHDSWTNTFNEPELLPWLFSNKK
jgi:predicted peptidase